MHIICGLKFFITHKKYMWTWAFERELHFRTINEKNEFLFLPCSAGDFCCWKKMIFTLYLWGNVTKVIGHFRLKIIDLLKFFDNLLNWDVSGILILEEDSKIRLTKEGNPHRTLSRMIPNDSPFNQENKFKDPFHNLLRNLKKIETTHKNSLKRNEKSTVWSLFLLSDHNCFLLQYSFLNSCS